MKQTFDRAVGRVVKSEGDEFAVDVHVRYVGVRSVPYGGAFVIGGTFRVFLYWRVLFFFGRLYRRFLSYDFACFFARRKCGGRRSGAPGMT